MQQCRATWKNTTFVSLGWGIISHMKALFPPAMKNNTDKKFSYQQLPVSLKLIYTILQVLVWNDWIIYPTEIQAYWKAYE